MLPALTEDEQERFKMISGIIKKEQHYPIKGVLSSKSFLKSFTLDSGKMVSSGGINAEDKLVGDTAHIAGNEGESHIFRDDPS